MDTFNNCESYMSKLMRKDRPQTMPVSGSKVTSNVANKGKPNVSSKNSVAPLKTKPKQQNIQSGSKGYSEVTSIPHKEVFSENGALVEVTVKTSKGRQRSNLMPEKETWGKVLQTQNSDKGSTFNSFDPLRTLHFLAKELQFKLQNDLPEDSSVLQIILDIQNALKRVPPEIASTINILQSNDLINLQKINSDSSVSAQKCLKPASKNKTIQTSQKVDDAAFFQKIMEESTLKLEDSCRQMEMLCGRLKSEKDELEEQLRIEKENVKFLKKRVGDLETQTEQLVSVTIKHLEEEKNDLQSQVVKLTDIVDSQSSQNNQEFKNLKQELRQVTVKADKDIMQLKHQLALANMEKEKYVAILSVRDRQINEIRSEMAQLQDVVNEQLVDIHNNALTDFPSTNSLGTEDVWNMPRITTEHSEGDHCSPEFSTINSNEMSFESDSAPKAEATSIKGNICGDAPRLEPLSATEAKQHQHRRVESKQSIRDMISELKKQALAVASGNVSSKQPTKGTIS